MSLPNLKDAKIRTNKEIKIIRDDYKVSENMKTIGIGKKYFLKTYGCQMNVHDSENIKAILEDMSFEETIDMEDADIIILNTCAIRENAHNKMFGFLGRVKHLKQSKKDIICGICGCMAQEETVVDNLKNKYKWVDIVFGTHNIHKLPEILEESINKQKQEIEVFSIEGDVYEGIPVKRDSKYKAWVNIQYGCDKFCTYCIVPYTRGKQRSRLPIDIINEVKDLVKDGYKEVTLLGQNVNAYGKDLDIDYTMSDLLEETAKTGIERVRFVTSHPWDFDDEMIDVIAKYDNIMPYIHLPLQSGSDRILKLMGRRYTKESYLELYKKFKDKVKNASITTDIIVGFPGETQKDFEDLKDFISKVEFDHLGVFAFSNEEDTEAYTMENQVDGKLAKKREKEIMKMQQKISLKLNKKRINEIHDVLIEDFDGNNYYGRSYLFAPDAEDGNFIIHTNKNLIIGEYYKVKISNVSAYDVEGEL